MRSLLLTLPAAALGLLALHREAPKAVAPAAKAVAKPTYARDVAPILSRSCVSCHQPGEVAPFSLAGYDAAKKWGAMSSQVTKTGVMPPWKAASGYGEFQHENRLTEGEVATLANWVATGAPRGDKRLEPALPTPPKDGWAGGAPDMVVGSKGTYQLEADGGDVYRNFVIQNPSDKPMWVRGMDVRPGNKRVVHHVIVFVDAAHQGRNLLKRTTDGKEGYVSTGGGAGFLPSGSLGGWAPGGRPYMIPDGKAFLVPAGADLVMQVHYHKDGKPETDATKVGIYLAKAPVEQEVKLAWLVKLNLTLPAGEKDIAVHREFPMSRNLTLYSVMPHMHVLGQSMRAKLLKPDGTETPIVFVPKWDFNWQLNYILKEPLKVPAGSKLVVDAVYDNSTGNPNNPNPTPKTVRWGEETTDEMFLLVATYTVDGEVLSH